jgi:uncharacterized protein (DUF885 family)
VLLVMLGACGLPGGTSYSGSIPPNEDAALDAFLAEARLAAEDRTRLKELLGTKRGRSLSWVTADPRWVQIDLSQRRVELRRLGARFSSNALSPDQDLRFETEWSRLTREKEAIEYWRGRDLLWPEEGTEAQEDWLLGDARPVELEGTDSLEDGAVLEEWFARMGVRGRYLAALERELAEREERGLLPAATGVLRALARVRTARETQLPGWLALLTARLAGEENLSAQARAEWRARGAEVLQAALGDRLDGLAQRLAGLAERAPSGSLASGEEDSAYYQHLLLQATTLPPPALEFHRLHKQEVERIHGQLRAHFDQADSTRSLAEWLADKSQTPVGQVPQASTPFRAWSQGWELYKSARGEALPDLARRLDAYALAATDTGIHARGWTREEALTYLQRNTPMGTTHASRAIDSMYLYPGRAVGPPAGFEQFLSIRARCEQRWGPDFDDEPLHELIRATGPVPLKPLSVRVLRWMSTR